MEPAFVFLGVAIVIAIAVLTVVLVGTRYLVWIGGRLVALPGVVVHEFAHKVACDLVGVRVLEVVYFRFGDPAGYVRHAHPRRYRASFVISVAPFLLNTVVAVAIFVGLATLIAEIGGFRVLRSAQPESLAVVAALAWLGLSIGTAAFPSTGDANTLWSRSKAEWRGSPTVLLGVPIVAVIYVANLLSWLWADRLYALSLAVVAFSVTGVVSF